MSKSRVLAIVAFLSIVSTNMSLAKLDTEFSLSAQAKSKSQCRVYENHSKPDFSVLSYQERTS